MASAMSVPAYVEEPTVRMKRLVAVANDFRVDRNLPIRRYYNSGVQMLRMGDVYYDEENTENAYVLYLKYLTLFVEKLRQHPEFKSQCAPEKSRINSHVRRVMERSEKLKLTLKSSYERQYAAWKASEEERERLEKQARAKEGQRLREELGKRYHDEKEKTLAAQRDYEAALFHQIQADKEAEAEQLELAIKMSKQHEAEGKARAERNTAAAVPPDRSTKPSAPSSSAAAPPPENSLPSVPDRSTKPSSASLYSNAAGGLRTVVVPSMAEGKFLSVAQPNTSRNVETCAILAGKLSRDRFRITHLLVPKQTGTSDSCATSNEEAIFEFQDKHELITLGWIHTHPSQTAFLSSVDLHTHASYQLMLPEALAIVCAPKYNETGYFVLTQNYGLDYIANCVQTGFHPHPKEPPLFETASHIQMDDSEDVKLVDLR